MLNKIDLGLALDKKSYKNELESLEEKLCVLQLKIRDLRIPVLIVFEGWSAAGKGTQINRILQPLDPRYFNVYTLSKVHEDAYMRPYLWSFFVKTPEKGRITILDKSWLRGLMPGEEGFRLTDKEKDGLFDDINAFEEQLINDGTVIIKFFLHIGKEEQSRRLAELRREESTKWRADDGDLKQNKHYDKYLSFFDKVLERTGTDNSRWEIIAAEDKNYATARILNIIVGRLEAEVQKRETAQATQGSESSSKGPALPYVMPLSVLDSVNLSLDITEEEYKRKLRMYRREMNDICYKLYNKRRAVVIVYEGWDAAGKGGNIKRLTEGLDPRGYEVIPIQAPTAEELSHHYLWRFWKKIPKDGHIAIFDRSWYGRVMVERIEGFCTEDEWRRAYKEINDMERAIANHGVIIMKFWLHIDKDEQMARFISRQQNPLKSYKITDEDWRNREKWDLYEEAVNEMIIRTDTPYAPWSIIESNSKKYARVAVLEQVINTVKRQI